MEVYSVFAKLKKIENIVGELYTFLYKKISHLYPDLGELFRQLAEEEKGHENIITMAKDIFLESNDTFGKNKDAASLINSMMESISKKIAEIKNRIIAIRPAELIQAVYDLENDLEARHYSVYIIVEDEQIKNLLNSLASMDEAHRDKIKSFMEKYKTA